MKILLLISIAFLSYLIGSLNPAYFVSKYKFHKDIRNFGSKNPGTSNMTLIYGFKFGVLVCFLDILKGYLAVILVGYFFGFSPFKLYVAGLGVILGHDFSFLLKFRGGKGTATFIGVALAIHPLFGLLAILGIVLIALLSDYMTLGTMAMYIFSGFYVILNYSNHVSFLFLIVFFLSIGKHLGNFQNIYLGKEDKISPVLFKKK